MRTDTEHGLFFVCDGCQGRAVSLAVVRKMAGRQTTRRLWTEANSGQSSEGVGCPICHRTTAEVAAPADHGHVPLDICTGCQFVWFDPAELERFPEPPEPPSEEELSPEAREEAAVGEAERVAEEARHEERPFAGPADTWQWIPGLLGMPVECRASPVRSTPWLTWGLAAVLAFVFGLTYQNAWVLKQFGLIPAEAWQSGGLTLLSSFFLHGGLLHLIGNVYFLLVFGDNVEDYLGRLRYALLLLAATVAGGAAHVLSDPGSTHPCIGASGGISGVVTFYAFRFPQARLGLLLRYWVLFRWVYMPAWFAFILWLVLQSLFVFLQTAGLSNVSALSHLGGAAVGLIAWILWRQK
ncbi:MAG: rhomboid family intramembrane serine protease [Planctomycetota bacterium]